MAFHLSAQDLELDDGHILKGQLANADGEWVDAEIDLNQFLGNDNGNFQWGGENFSHSAEDIEFSLEGDDNVPILRAKLGNLDGEQNDSDINLSEHIGNNNGEFFFTGTD